MTYAPFWESDDDAGGVTRITVERFGNDVVRDHQSPVKTMVELFGVAPAAEYEDVTLAIPAPLFPGAVVYVAGPMTGYPRWNFDAFFDAADALRRRGWRVVNPAEHDVEGGFDPDAEPVDDPEFRAECLRWDVAQIAEADAIFFLPGWEHSKGATLEHAVADACGLSIYGAEA